MVWYIFFWMPERELMVASIGTFDNGFSELRTVLEMPGLRNRIDDLKPRNLIIDLVSGFIRAAALTTD